MQPTDRHHAEFLAHYQAGQDALLYAEIHNDLLTPVSAYLAIESPASFLLESVEQGKGKGRYSFIGWHPLILWETRHDGSTAAQKTAKAYKKEFTQSDKNEPVWQESPLPPLKDLEQLLNDHIIPFPEGLPPAASGFFGFLTYDAIGLVEKIPPHQIDNYHLPLGRYFLPERILIFDNSQDKIFLVVRVRWQKEKSADEALKAGLAIITDTTKLLTNPITDKTKKSPTPSAQPIHETSEAEFANMVSKAKDYIKDGDIFQVVLSQVFRFDNITLRPFDFYRSLRTTNPAPYMYYFSWNDFAFAGASPETLVKVENKQVTIYPIAGTRPRGKDEAEDKKLEKELLADDKERAEHLMLLDLGRNDVGRVAKTDSVKVKQEFQIVRYRYVMHIVSEVIGELADDKTSLAALLAGLPAGTVSGAPKIRAMEIISELEKTRRGLYAGAVGYFSSQLRPDHKDTINQADLDHCIALRTALIINGSIIIQAGGGVVYDSNAPMEQQECINKAKALVRAYTTPLA